ncbi:activating signal cointegrator 1-like isoform X1 [Leptotrombidium deliense]|uniref:Activating signal cointegrator 1-like isoform X1 n=1 Tax=Leptotrombidium deliense TaxID=299467 RepID=A0A443SWK7_9ACAR|nr:activating signal cointegrator 1-like isoform X1 [Leptotrombidium deliense]
MVFEKESSKENSGSVKTGRKGKKPSFVPLYSEEGKEMQTILLPGRQPCLCEASVHKLISNCLNCGRIVCSQEQSGPCFTCGQPVFSPQERQQMIELELKAAEERKKEVKLPTVNKKSEEKQQGVSGLKDIAASFEKAVELKNKLLDYDQNAKTQTKIIDDESDYFRLSSEHWLSDEQRREISERVDTIHEKKHSKTRKLVFDFHGKQLTAVNVPDLPDLESAVKDVEEKTKLQSDYEIVDSKEVDTMFELPRPTYYQSNEARKKQTSKGVVSINKRGNFLENLRVQDSNLMEMSDEGICLSIRQPWASFLLNSLKLHEGRNWYTPYRGRVWIHAASREPRKEEISEAENLFRMIGDFTDFPSTYPTGVLLGFAHLVDCLPQEDYKLQYPNGYVDNLYTFIFEEPVLLNVKIPMTGGAKLFKLSGEVFKAAKSQIKF